MVGGSPTSPTCSHSAPPQSWGLLKARSLPAQECRGRRAGQTRSASPAVRQAGCASSSVNEEQRCPPRRVTKGVQGETHSQEWRRVGPRTPLPLRSFCTVGTVSPTLQVRSLRLDCHAPALGDRAGRWWSPGLEFQEDHLQSFQPLSHLVRRWYCCHLG